MSQVPLTLLGTLAFTGASTAGAKTEEGADRPSSIAVRDTFA